MNRETTSERVPRSWTMGERGSASERERTSESEGMSEREPSREGENERVSEIDTSEGDNE